MATAETAATAGMTDIGPINNLVLPIPEHGGVVVLRGSHGTGKSTGLRAAASALGSKESLDPRDGTAGGSVRLAGITLTVGRATRRKGELEVTSLESRLGVADFVDPGLESPEAADAKRIKALIQITGVSPEPKLFYDIVGGQAEYERICSRASGDDLVQLAARVKRDLEDAAQREEHQAAHNEGHAAAALEAAGKVDVTRESDERTLQAKLEEALHTHSGLQQKAKAASNASASIVEARRKLEEAKTGHQGPTVDEAKAEEDAAAKAERIALELVNEARKRLEEAKAELVEIERQHAEKRLELSSAIQARKAAEAHEDMIAGWTEQLTLSCPLPPDESELAAAAAALEAARAAQQLGVEVRLSLQHLEQEAEYRRKAATHRQKAESLRSAANGVNDVLSGVVAKTGSRLRVKNGRLVLDTDRGEELFADLSDGEKWDEAIELAIEVIGDGGMMVIPQNAWEGLLPTLKNRIARHAIKRRVVIITAEVTFGQLRAEEFVVAEG